VVDSCYCHSTFDHNLADIVVDTPLVEMPTMTVKQVCDLIGDAPEGFAGRPHYNDIQCGHGPPNDSPDEVTCPGRTEYGAEGCKYIGPPWNFAPFLPEEQDGDSDSDDHQDDESSTAPGFFLWDSLKLLWELILGWIALLFRNEEEPS